MFIPLQGGFMQADRRFLKRVFLIITYTVVLITLCVRISVCWRVLCGTVRVCFPFVLGGGMAFTLNVLMCVLERWLSGCIREKHLRRALALAGTLLLVITIFILMLQLVVPELGKSANLLLTRLPVLYEKLRTWFLSWYEGEAAPAWLSELQLDMEGLRAQLASFLQHGLTPVMEGAYGLMSGTVAGLVDFVIGLVFAVYVLLQKERLQEQARMLLYAYIPGKWAVQIEQLLHITNMTFRHFIAGQCMEALILGSLFFVAMTFFRVPYALMISVLIGVFALIPLFGAFVGCAVGVLLILTVSPAKALCFFILFLALQQIEGNLIYPHVVGNSVGLPSIWVLVAVTVGGSLMGIWGILLFIPLTSVLYTLLKRDVHRRLEGARVIKWNNGERT